VVIKEGLEKQGTETWTEFQLFRAAPRGGDVCERHLTVTFIITFSRKILQIGITFTIPVLVSRIKISNNVLRY
jgi:hypothetical protein